MIVNPPPAPTVDLYWEPNKVDYGADSTLHWSSTNATSCDLSGKETTATSGSWLGENRQVSQTATFKCSGPGGSSQEISAFLEVSPPQAATATLSWNKTTVEYGGNAVLSWNSENATECELSSGETVSSSGTKPFSNIKTEIKESIVCTGAAGASEVIYATLPDPITARAVVAQNCPADISHLSLPILSADFSAQQSLYVDSLSGDDNNNGLTKDQALQTIQAAVNKAGAGYTIYVKAGLYNESFEVNVKASQNQPLVIEGYNDAGLAPNFNEKAAFDQAFPLAPGFNPVFDSARMPLLDGGDSSTGVAVNLKGSAYVVFRNFQIKRYKVGIIGGEVDHSLIENVYLSDFGDKSYVLDSAGNKHASYSGTALGLGQSTNYSAATPLQSAQYNVIRNVVVVNALAEGISINYARNNLIDGVKVYGSQDHSNDDMPDSEDNKNDGPDYYVTIGHGADNVIMNSHVEMLGSIAHGGHGFAIKGYHPNDIINHSWMKKTGYNPPPYDGKTLTSQNNLVACNTYKKVVNGIRGSAFQCRHRGCKGNVFAYNTVEGGNYSYIMRDGAHDNMFRDSHTEKANFGIVFADADEDEQLQSSGDNNLVEKVSMSNMVQSAISFNSWNYTDTSATGNELKSLEVYDSASLFNVSHYTVNNKLHISSMSNVNKLHQDTDTQTLTLCNKSGQKVGSIADVAEGEEMTFNSTKKENTSLECN